MKTFVSVSALFIIIACMGCGPSMEEKAAKEKAYQDAIIQTADSVSAGNNGPTFMSSSAAVVDKRIIKN